MHRFLSDPWYRSTCIENKLSLKDMYRFEANGNPENRTHLYQPMTKREREAAGLQRWIPDIEYGADQGGNDSNYRQRQPKAKQQKKDDSGWKQGSWPSAGSNEQWGTTAAPKKDEWKKSDWWYT